MNEEELRKEAVRRRRLGESSEMIATDLGRTSRWVRKWVARHDEGSHDETWAASRSRAPHTSPSRTPDELRQLILDARARLVANPRTQYGALAIAWELRHMGVEPIPERRTIERETARAGLARPRRRQSRYMPKGVPYPSRLARGGDVPPGRRGRPPPPGRSGRVPRPQLHRRGHPHRGE